MDLRQMRHFVAVAEERHFGKAARRLNMAQPPLSQSIMRLEEELGAKLLERSRRGVWLTPAGSVFLAEAQRTLMQADLARTVTQRAASLGPQRLNVSFVGPALYRVLPAILSEFREKHPYFCPRLFELSSPEQMAGLRQGTYDVAFVVPTPDLVEAGDQFLVERAEYVIAAPEGSRLAKLESIHLADLQDEMMILAPADESPIHLSALQAACRAVGFVPIATHEATQANVRLSLVAAGVGYSFVPATAALSQRSGVVYVPVRDMPTRNRFEMMITWRPQHATTATKAFVELTKAYVDANPHLIELNIAAEKSEEREKKSPAGRANR
jgi:DNA-binding transcriptional LysR family regulator